MSEYIISKRYAKALLSLAEECNLIEKILYDFKTLNETYQASSDLQKLLKEPKIKHDLKIKTFQQIARQISSQIIFINFIAIIVKKHRINLLDEIYKIYKKLAYQKIKKISVDLIVAYSLSDQQLLQLKREFTAYTHKDVEFNIQIDPTLIGGIIAQINSVLFDGSILNYLNLIRKKIIQ